MRWWSRAALLALLTLAACGGSARPVRTDQAVLVVSCPVQDAVLWVDGRYQDQLRDLPGGVALAPGRHQIELRHDRYHAYYGEVELGRGQRLRLDVQLAEALP
jgi:PEGA domain